MERGDYQEVQGQSGFQSSSGKRDPQDPDRAQEGAKGVSFTLFSVGVRTCNDRFLCQGKVWVVRIGHMLVVRILKADKGASLQRVREDIRELWKRVGDASGFPEAQVNMAARMY